MLRSTGSSTGEAGMSSGAVAAPKVESAYTTLCGSEKMAVCRGFSELARDWLADGRREYDGVSGALCTFWFETPRVARLLCQRLDKECQRLRLREPKRFLVNSVEVLRLMRGAGVGYIEAVSSPRVHS
jgi:hypothetical protein